MALTRVLGSALTGLNGQAFKMDVIGNNIANATTTGFKSSRVDFKTMLSQTLRFGSGPQGSLGGINPLQIGLGTQIGSSSMNFLQGDLQSTGVRTDLAIDGNGFFVLHNGQGDQRFTRAGVFGLNENNNLYDPSNGYLVQGINADLTNFTLPASGPLENIVIPLNDLQIARATENIVFDGNLNSGGDIALMGSTHQSAELVNINTSATALPTTLLTDLGRATPSGDLDLLIDTGDTITISANKGGRVLPELRFNVGTTLLDGYDGFGETVQDLVNFIERALGVNTATDRYGAVRDNDTNPNTIGVSYGSNVVDTAAVPPTVRVNGVDFLTEGVHLGDILRFNSGAGAGQIVTVTGFQSVGVGESNNVLEVSTFTGNIPDPSSGDLFTIHEPAGVNMVQTIGNPNDNRNWLTEGAIYIAGNVGLANALSDIRLTNATDNINISPFTQIEAATGESIITNSVVFDSIGQAHNVEQTYVLETKGEVDPISGNVGNIWRVYSEAASSMFLASGGGTIEGTDRRVGTGTITLGTDGQFLSQQPDTQTTFLQLSIPNQGAVTPQLILTDFSGLTGFADIVSNPFMESQDGFQTGTLVDFAVDQDGTVQGIFNNGILRQLARVQLARFSNNDGLEHLGDSYFQVGANSGQAIVGRGTTDGFGSLVGGALEGSNVDFAKEFTDLIVAQRAFTANARVITRADEMLDNLIAIV